jgi:DNA polymerase-1
MSENGFWFDYDRALGFLRELQEAIATLEATLVAAFPRKAVPGALIAPKGLKNGALSVVGLKWAGPDLTMFTVGAPFTRVEWEDFNPRSSKQRIERLWEAGWKPYEKTKGHQQAIRTKDKEALKRFEKYGWTTSENNLSTLPEEAPAGARTLARYLILNARLKMLTTWLKFYNEKTHRIHGSLNHIGSWTHRMSHDNPNVGNITGNKRRDNTVSPYGRQFRELWGVPPGKLQVGTDASGIQARVFAHYLNSPEFINACVNGSSETQDDIHYLNWKIIGDVCPSRNVCKTFFYAWILGAGFGKIAEILKCTPEEAREIDVRFQKAYPGYAILKSETIPKDQRAGFFKGFDGRLVLIPEPRLVMAGYLQNGEACIMKLAATIWNEELTKLGISYKWMNFVHDEWQTELDNDLDLCHTVGRIQAQSIKTAGTLLNLRCPQDGEYKIGRNWYATHSEEKELILGQGTSRGRTY